MDTAFFIDWSFSRLSLRSSSFSRLSRNFICACMSLIDFSIRSIFFSYSATFPSSLLHAYCPHSFISFLPFLFIIICPFYDGRCMGIQINAHNIIKGIHEVDDRHFPGHPAPPPSGHGHPHPRLACPRNRVGHPAGPAEHLAGDRERRAGMELSALAGHLLPLRVPLRTQRCLFFKLALNITGDLPFKSQFDPQFLRAKLLREQEQDGSWKQLVDLNQKHGSLDATIFNCTAVFIQTGS